MGRALDDQSAEPAFKALMLALPSESDLAQAVSPVDPAAIHEAREALRVAAGGPPRRRCCARLHGGLQDAGEFSPDADAAGRRALRNAALELLAADPHADNRRARRRPLPRRRQHDRRHGRAERPDADRRRGVRRRPWPTSTSAGRTSRW